MINTYADLLANLQERCNALLEESRAARSEARRQAAIAESLSRRVIGMDERSNEPCGTSSRNDAPREALEAMPVEDVRSPERKARWAEAEKEIREGRYERPRRRPEAPPATHMAKSPLGEGQ